MTAEYSMVVPVEIYSTEIMIDVEYSHTKGSPAVMYLRNGDPGYPAEPAEIEILSLKVAGVQVPEWFDKAVEEHVLDWLHNHHEEPEQEYEGGEA